MKCTGHLATQFTDREESLRFEVPTDFLITTAFSSQHSKEEDCNDNDSDYFPESIFNDMALRRPVGEALQVTPTRNCHAPHSALLDS